MSMKEEIMEQYLKIEDKISEEEFQEQLDQLKEEYAGTALMDDVGLAKIVVGKYHTEKTQARSNSTEKIGNLKSGQKVILTGRVTRIGQPKKFLTKKGRKGKVANIQIQDETGEIRVVLWSETIPKIKDVNEGDIITINRVEIKDGYRDKEATVPPRAKITKEKEEDHPELPKYEEKITNIEDLQPDTEANVIARIIRIPKIRSYQSNGKEGKVTSIELQDKTGKIPYTLWNKDTDLIEELELEEGDSIKILGARCTERNDELGLSHPFVGRIVKGNFDVPEIEIKITPIGEADESKDITLLGLVSKVQDTITFQRQDATEGYVKSIEIIDTTGSIRITLWGDDTSLEINKGDILKVTGANIEMDEYSPSGLRANTGWNSRIIINPPHEDPNTIEELEQLKDKLQPISIIEVQDYEDDGEEIDTIGRIITINEPREFQREDTTTGVVRSIDLADQTGTVRVSLWDEKAKTTLEIGQPVLLENARTKMGLYNVDLSIGKTSRIVPPTPEQEAKLPSLEEIQESLYTTKKIDDLDEEDRNTRLIGRIMDLNAGREFQRSDGTTGYVRSMELADETGVITASLWDEQATKEIYPGDAIRLENPRIIFRDDHLELNIGQNTQIYTATNDESEQLPSYEELQKTAYVTKTVEELEEEDLNIRINGQLTDTRGDRILLYKCPICNGSLESGEDGYFCEYCSTIIEEPRYLLMLPGKIADDTGEIDVTFFGELAEHILGKTTDGVVDIITNSTDDGALQDIVEELNGITLTLIADVTFNNYSEELSLRPKRILE